MAISTRMPRNPVTPSAQSPPTGARPSSWRPSSVKNPTAASRSSTTMPTLSIRLTVMSQIPASFSQDLIHRLALCKLIDQLVEVANLLHQRIVDFLYADTAHDPLDERSIGMKGRG